MNRSDIHFFRTEVETRVCYFQQQRGLRRKHVTKAHCNSFMDGQGVGFPCQDFRKKLLQMVDAIDGPQRNTVIYGYHDGLSVLKNPIHPNRLANTCHRWLHNNTSLVRTLTQGFEFQSVWSGAAQTTDQAGPLSMP